MNNLTSFEKSVKSILSDYDMDDFDIWTKIVDLNDFVRGSRYFKFNDIKFHKLEDKVICLVHSRAAALSNYKWFGYYHLKENGNLCFTVDLNMTID